MIQHAIFGGGCFWCTEAVFLAVDGVKNVLSGYAGGTPETANYEAVCTGQTGHAEVIEMEYDDEVVDYETLLNIFFMTHDPTTLNRQGNDIGTQYRSVIFYLDEMQRELAEQKVKELHHLGIHAVTEISPAPIFYPAEEYHQNFYAKNPMQGYCNLMIPPKLMKLKAYYLSIH